MNGISTIITEGFFISEVSHIGGNWRVHSIPTDFKLGDEVMVIPYDKGVTVIDDGEEFFINFPIRKLITTTVKKSGKTGRMVYFKNMDSDLVLICKNNHYVFTRMVVCDYVVKKLKPNARSNCTDIPKKLGWSSCLALPVFEDITTISENEDGGYIIESYSELIGCKKLSPSRSRLCLPSEWYDLEVVVVEY